MGKITEFYLCVTPDSKNAMAVANADDTDLAILGALYLTASEDGRVDISAVEALERFESTEIAASLKFWRGAGIITASRKSQSAVKETAHKDGVVEHTGIESYSNDELARALERSVGSAFVDEAQSVMGKIFNKNEVGKLVGFVDQLGFEQEAVLAILAYCVRLGKKSLSYAEKIAISFHDEDIFTSEAVHAQIDYLEKRNTAIEKIRSLYGFGGRALTTTEKKYFTSWTEEYGFDYDIIVKAYEITVDTIQSPVPKYTDAILKKWHDNGLRSIEEIELFIAEEKKKAVNGARASARTTQPRSQKAVSEKGKEIDDWFEAKLNKRFGN